MIGSISLVFRGDARKMIQSINRFSPDFCSLSQYVSLIMSLQCLTDPVIFLFPENKSCTKLHRTRRRAQV